MKLKNLVRRTVSLAAAAFALAMTACDAFHEDLPECRLYVEFKYDYNVLSVDAFHRQVGRVDLYVFDKEGKYLFTQTASGAALSTGDFRMEVNLPAGEYKFMAWAYGNRYDSYDVSGLTAGVSGADDLTLKLKRDGSPVVDERIDPLWHGAMIDVRFTGDKMQTETIDLVKDTNTIRFGFSAFNEGATINVDDYTYELLDDNGYYGSDNSPMADDILSYRPYLAEQVNEASVVVELNTMRLMYDHGGSVDEGARFIVREKSTGNIIFRVNLIDFLRMTEMSEYTTEYGWDSQEYLDRQDNYSIVIFIPEMAAGSFAAFRLVLNDWTYYYQANDL